MSMQEHLVYWTEANKPKLFITTGHCCFNEYDSTKLEDWLMDIERAADLMNGSQAKLAKAKSRGLTHTLVMEAINPDKSCEEIKDLLWPKLCNANTYLYLTFHGYPIVGKAGIHCSIHPRVQNKGKKMQLYK